MIDLPARASIASIVARHPERTESRRSGNVV